MATRLTKEQRIAAVKNYYRLGENRAEANRRLANQFGIPPPQDKTLLVWQRSLKKLSDIQRPEKRFTATNAEKENEMVEANNNNNQQQQVFKNHLEATQRNLKHAMECPQVVDTLGMKPCMPQLLQAHYVKFKIGRYLSIILYCLPAPFLLIYKISFGLH